MKKLFPTFIGVSPSLTENAPGHYLPFHGKLHDAFRSKNPLSIYLGGAGADEEKLWWRPWAPYSLRSKPNHLSLSKFRELCVIARENRNPFFVVYEGSLYHLVLFSCLSGISKSPVLVNLHYSSELSKSMESKLGQYFVRNLHKLCKSIANGSIVVTSESEELSSEIERRIGIFPKPFPVFSVLAELEDSEVSEMTHTWIICRLVHQWQVDALIDAINHNPDENFLVNGLNEDQKKIFRGIPNVQIQDLFLTSLQYRKLLADSKQLVLAYDTGMYRGHSSGRLLDAMVFRKRILTIEGMPIPKFAREYSALKLVPFRELGANLRIISPGTGANLALLPNASWAVEQISEMYSEDIQKVNRFSITSFFLPRFSLVLLTVMTFFMRAYKSIVIRLKGKNSNPCS